MKQQREKQVNIAEPLLGGVLLALCVLILSWTMGKVLGVSGYVDYLLQLPFSVNFHQHFSLTSENVHKLFFLVGMLVSGFISQGIGSLEADGMGVVSEAPGSIALLLCGGFLVGLGTSLANGCTSGHGLCGLTRGSKRSFMAVACFFASAVATRGILRMINGSDSVYLEIEKYEFTIGLNWLKIVWKRTSVAVIGIAVSMVFSWLSKIILGGNTNSILSGFGRCMIACNVGLLFAQGLAISGMTNWRKIVSFLDLPWTAMRGDFSLAILFAAAVLPNILSHYIVSKTVKIPIFDSKWYFPVGRKVDRRLILGSVIFGIGWALCGICPGPAVAVLFPSIVSEVENWIGYWWLGYALGTFTETLFFLESKKKKIK